MKQAAWAGTYQCIAENVSGRALSRNITVQSGYIKKRFEKQPKDVEVRIGQGTDQSQVQVQFFAFLTTKMSPDVNKYPLMSRNTSLMSKDDLKCRLMSLFMTKCLQMYPNVL